MQIISLGGGVQSSALVLMSVSGEIDPPAEAAIFADTGWEQQGTYQYLEWLKKYVWDLHRFPIFIARTSNIRQDMLDPNFDGRIPFYTKSEKGTGQLRRQCTTHYKIRPIRRTLREKFGFQPFTSWIGISLDEVARAKPSRVKYITHRFPLLEKRMYRADCIAWLKKNGFPVPGKSSCVGCPYRSNSAWDRMKKTAPKEFEDACEFDASIRDNHIKSERYKDFPLYLHDSLQPLSDVEFKNPDQMTLWGETEECEGGCFL